MAEYYFNDIFCPTIYWTDIAYLKSQEYKPTRRKLDKLGEVLAIIRNTPNPADLPKSLGYHTFDYSYHGVDYGTVADVHIEGDCVLLYKIDYSKKLLTCIRIGTHRRLGIGASTSVSGDYID